MARKGKSTEEIIQALREAESVLDRRDGGKDLPGLRDLGANVLQVAS